jgi:hypothetical protein
MKDLALFFNRQNNLIDGLKTLSYYDSFVGIPANPAETIYLALNSTKSKAIIITS